MPPSLSPRESASWGESGRHPAAPRGGSPGIQERTQPHNLTHRILGISGPIPLLAIGRATRHRRSAIGLIAGIIGLGLVGLCLAHACRQCLPIRTLVAQIAEPAHRHSGRFADHARAGDARQPSMSIDPTTATQPSVTAGQVAGEAQAQEPAPGQRCRRAGRAPTRAAKKSVRSTTPPPEP